MKRIALIGNPNCGKTTLFNRLTGLSQKTSNLPGTTVEAYIGKSYYHKEEITWVDLPGIYSLFTDSEYEHVVIQHLLQVQTPSLDGIIFVLDASNLRRNLLLWHQVSDLGIPAAAVLTMTDTAKRRDIKLPQNIIEDQLGIKIAPFNPRTDKNTHVIFDLLQELRVAPKSIFADGITERLQKFTDGVKQTGISEETLRRYGLIDRIIQKIFPKKQTFKAFNTLKIDRVLIHPVWGLLTFIFIMMVLFQGVFTLAETPMGYIEEAFAFLKDGTENLMEHGLAQSFVKQGILSGLEGVVVFIPQIFILFFLIGILEDSGYMVRASFISDRIMRKLGLNGRSIIPLVGGFACAIPSIMATRSIRNKKERLATMIVVPLMSCSARLPVYVLLISLAVSNEMRVGPFSIQTLMMTGAYFIGIFMAVLISFLFKIWNKTQETSEFILEMPTYQFPRWQTVIQSAWIKCKSFLMEAGKIILIISIVLWGLSSFGPSEAMQKAVTRAQQECASLQDSLEQEIQRNQKIQQYTLEASYAGHMGKAIEPIIKPLGYDWKTGIALISSFAAREVFVGTMSTLFTHDTGDEELVGIRKKMQAQIDPITQKPRYGLPYAISLMFFYAFALQCVSTMAVMKKETGTWKWPIVLFITYGLLAYVTAFCAYQGLQ
jgi:ferrous iron transport protein B